MAEVTGFSVVLGNRILVQEPLMKQLGHLGQDVRDPLAAIHSVPY